MAFDKIAEISLLYDFYGQLLTKRQQDVMLLYHEENYTLAEIASEFSISRQGVHDALKNAEKALHEYEKKLKLVEKFDESRQTILRIDKAIDEIIKSNPGNENLTDRLKDVKTIIDRFDQ